MNFVHLKILKLISLGKTKWVCSWPYFNAKIGSLHWAMACLPKAFVSHGAVSQMPVLCMVVRLQASPREFVLCQCCPKGPQVFHLCPPTPSQEYPLNWDLLSLHTCPDIWHFSLSDTPTLFLPQGFLNCCTVSRNALYEFTWMLPSQWKVSSNGTSEILSLTSSDKVPMPPSPTPS